MKPELIYKGSVKNVYQVSDGNLFEFSDRYSVFDWGEMPDQLERKGEALALMGALFFKVMGKHDIEHHFINLADSTGNELPTLTPTKFMKVKSVPVVWPELSSIGDYNYEHYQNKPKEGLVPLEVIFRFGLGKGSSLVKRAQKDESLLKQWGLSFAEEGMRFEEPIIDFSTKLEKGDRHLTHLEAKKLAGLSDHEFNELIVLNKKVAIILNELCNEIGLELWDGKTEWAFLSSHLSAERSFMLVDTIGLDELRLEIKGESLSKEFLRQYYKGSNWYVELEQAKKIGSNFKEVIKCRPEKLPGEIKYRAESLYLSFTNELSDLLNGTKPFGEEYTLNKWVELKS